LRRWNTFSINITVDPLPASAGTISGLTDICQGQNFVTYTVSAIPNANSYVWTLPSGATGTSSTNSIIVNYSAAAASGSITVKGSNSCGDGEASTLAINITLPVESAGIISGMDTVCQGQSSIIYVVPTIANATSYVWTLPNGATGTSTNNSINVNYGTSAVTSNIAVKGTNTCGDGISSTKLINVNPLPASAGTISGLTDICQGQDFVTYTIPAIAYSNLYVWTLPEGATGTSTTSSIVVNYDTTAVSGYIAVKGKNDCGDGAASTLAIIVYSVPPTPTITLNGNILHSDAVTGNQWYNEGVLISGAISQDYTILANGDYYVIVSLDGCDSDSSNHIFINDAGFGNIEINNLLQVYPNPFTNELIIEIEGNNDVISLEIFNSIGKVVFKGNVLEKIIVSTANFSDGVYLIKLEDGNSFELTKIIKQ